MPTPRFCFWALAAGLSVAIVLALTVGILRGDWFWEFEETGFVTTLSVGQILMLAFLALAVARVRLGQVGGSRRGAVFWILLACGFAFLALDESFELHERCDDFIHRRLGWVETGWTDRIDDLIVGAYAVVGLSFLVRFRRELILDRSSHPWIIAAFSAAGVSVGLDILVNRDDIVRSVLGESPLVVPILMVGGVGEESLKLVAEGLLFIGLYAHLYATAGESSRESEPLLQRS